MGDLADRLRASADHDEALEPAGKILRRERERRHRRLQLQTPGPAGEAAEGSTSEQVLLRRSLRRRNGYIPEPPEIR